VAETINEEETEEQVEAAVKPAAPREDKAEEVAKRDRGELFAEVVSRFEELVSLDVETFLVATPFSLEERIDIIEILGREVLPRFA